MIRLRYFYGSLLRSAFMTLVLFYGLYSLIDYSSHLSGAHYPHSKFSLGSMILHYLCELSLRADIFIPFSLLIGTLFSLTRMNTHSELVAFQAGGFSLRKLLAPYLYVGFGAVLLLYANEEWGIPAAAKREEKIRFESFHKKMKNMTFLQARSMHLEDKSLVIYKEFNPSSQTLHEVFWIPSIDNIWRIQILDPFSNPPQGFFVDHFARNANGQLAAALSTPTLPFPWLKFNKEMLKASLKVPENEPLSELLVNTPAQSSEEESEKTARKLTALYRKLALPWWALLAILGPAPFCVRYSRHSSYFTLFACWLFLFLASYLVIDALTVLGERQLISPELAIGCPTGALLMAAAASYFTKVR